MAMNDATAPATSDAFLILRNLEEPPLKLLMGTVLQPPKGDPSQVLSAIKSAFTLSSFVVIITLFLVRVKNGGGTVLLLLYVQISYLLKYEQNFGRWVE